MKPIPLNEKEMQLIRLICRQLTSKEIAEELGYGYRTIEEQRQLLQKKLGVRNAVGIALYAVKHGIIKVRMTK